MSILAIVISVILGLAVNECSAVSPWAADKVVRWSARLRYSDPKRAELRSEELSALIKDRPGNLFKLITALCFAAAGVRAWAKRGVSELYADIPAISASGTVALKKVAVASAAFMMALAVVPALEVLVSRSPAQIPQVLTQSEAEQVAGAVGRDLGAAWIPGSLPASAPAHVTYQPADCAALAHEDYLNALPGPLARAEDRYKAAPARADELETLSVRVESFSQSVSASLLTAASQIFRACPSYTTQTSGSQIAGSNGPVVVTTRAVSQPGPGVTMWRADISMNLEPGRASVTWIMITAGHSFLLISQQTISSGSAARPDEKVITAASTAAITTLRKLQQNSAQLPEVRHPPVVLTR